MNKKIQPFFAVGIFIIAVMTALPTLFSDKTILIKSASLVCIAAIFTVTLINDIPRKLTYLVLMLTLVTLVTMLFL